MSRSFGPGSGFGPGAGAPALASPSRKSAPIAASEGVKTASSPPREKGPTAGSPAPPAKPGSSDASKSFGPGAGPWSARGSSGYGPGRLGPPSYSDARGPPPPTSAGQAKGAPVSGKGPAPGPASGRGLGPTSPQSVPPGSAGQQKGALPTKTAAAAWPRPVPPPAQAPKTPSSPPRPAAAPSATSKQPALKKDAGRFPADAPADYGRNPTFLNGKPNIPFNFAYPCFEEENGLMFRLVDESAKIWAFYNDSTKLSVTVYMSFGEKSVLTPIGDVRLPFSNTKKAYEGRVVVPPRATLPIFKGSVTDYDLYFKAATEAG